MGAVRPLLLTAGGSAFFDRVVAKLAPLVADDGTATLVLRSGSIFSNDHGLYESAPTAIDACSGFDRERVHVPATETFRPVLRLWAEVLSRPEPRQAICGMGMRDVSFDQDLPRSLHVYGDGQLLPRGGPMPSTINLNDQHAFLDVPTGANLQVGDVVDFGVSHPCTCLHLYRMIFGVDHRGWVVKRMRPSSVECPATHTWKYPESTQVG